MERLTYIERCGEVDVDMVMRTGCCKEAGVDRVLRRVKVDVDIVMARVVVDVNRVMEVLRRQGHYSSGG